MGVSAIHVFPAYEDALYYLWRERKLPVNVDPLDAKLTDPQERARLARILGDTLGDAVGFVLPLGRPVDGAAWQRAPGFCAASAAI